MTDKLDQRVTSVMTHLMAELAVLDRREPEDMERVAKLIDDDHCRGAVIDLLLGIMPDRVDGEQWIAWVQGGPSPLPRPLRDPDSGGRPHSRGRMQAVQSRRDAAANHVGKLQAQLAQAQQDLAAAEADLQQANDQVRTVVAYRLMVEIGRQASGLALGPLYAIARGISPYLQLDLLFEDGLDVEARGLLEERRRTREKDSREILDRLDRHAGDQELELKLHRAILKVVRDFHQQREAVNKADRAAGKRLPESVKRRSVRRTFEAQQHSIHPAAPRSDVDKVFDAFRTVDEGVPADDDE